MQGHHQCAAKAKGDLVEAGEGSNAVAVIPSHNEERTIGSVLLLTRKHVKTIIVVDDGSTDATAEIAKEAGAIVVQHERNQGKGAALNTGFHRAIALNPRALVVLDGDGQHLSREIPLLLAPILAGNADITVGSRYLAEQSGVPRHRTWGHWAFTALTNATSGVRVTDSQSGFRAFSPRALEAITFSSAGFSVESEIQFLAQEHDLRLTEVSITADYAEKPKRSVVVHGLMVLNGLLYLIGQYRPLFFFGLAGLIVLLASLGWSAWMLLHQSTQPIAIGNALICVLLAIFGSLSLFAGLILHSVRGLLLSIVRPRIDA